MLSSSKSPKQECGMCCLETQRSESTTTLIDASPVCSPSYNTPARILRHTPAQVKYPSGSLFAKVENRV